MEGLWWKIHENPTKTDENWGYPYDLGNLLKPFQGFSRISKVRNVDIFSPEILPSKLAKLRKTMDGIWCLSERKINSGAIPNSLKASALFHFFFTLRNLTGVLHWKPLKSHQVSAPTLQKLTRYQQTAQEPSGTSTRNLHRNSPELCGTLPGTWDWSCTGSHQS